MPTVASAGATKAPFGTNLLAFSWPRPNKPSVVFDMATLARALGDIQIAARNGHDVPLGIGLGAAGAPITNPVENLKAVLLRFGGCKASEISMMIELLAGVLIGCASPCPVSGNGQ
ncbi:MAG: Ldh family oxidoreductase [Rhodobacteraceae bacterium]|nr:Ldh family oxidoreductase [Paracoccaceae bacterium]